MIIKKNLMLFSPEDGDDGGEAAPIEGAEADVLNAMLDAIEGGEATSSVKAKPTGAEKAEEVDPADLIEEGEAKKEKVEAAEKEPKAEEPKEAKPEKKTEEKPAAEESDDIVTLTEDLIKEFELDEKEFKVGDKVQIGEETEASEEQETTPASEAEAETKPDEQLTQSERASYQKVIEELAAKAGVQAPQVQQAATEPAQPKAEQPAQQAYEPVSFDLVEDDEKLQEITSSREKFNSFLAEFAARIQQSSLQLMMPMVRTAIPLSIRVDRMTERYFEKNPQLANVRGYFSQTLNKVAQDKPALLQEFTTGQNSKILEETGKEVIKALNLPAKQINVPRKVVKKVTGLPSSRKTQQRRSVSKVNTPSDPTDQRSMMDSMLDHKTK